MIFPCDQCGICCRHIDQIPQLKQFDSGNGKCIYLMDNNLCSIYQDRPDICNVERMYELLYKSKMTEEEYITANIKGCCKLKNQYGL